MQTFAFMFYTNLRLCDFIGVGMLAGKCAKTARLRKWISDDRETWETRMP